MSKKDKILLAALAAAVCLAAAGGFLIGKSAGHTEAAKEQELLQTLNRGALERLSAEEETVYVIGHRSPDADTVCSAIAYARLLNALGYRAEAAVTSSVDRETAYILKEAGVQTPPVLDDASGKSIFLVDHSEYAQAAQGMSDAHIVGIIDHHGIGTVTTGHQVVYEARPIGATATIVWLDYLNYGAEIDRTTAFLLLGAVLSDTDNLRGSTTTETDRQALSALAKRADVTDVDALYKAIRAEKLSYEGMSDEEIFFSDYKEYEVNGVKFGIGLVSTVDEEIAAALAERMKKILPACLEKQGVDLIYVSVGMRENGEKIDRVVPGSERSEEVLAAAFPQYDEYDGTSYIFRTGLGRKTLFVPGMTDYLTAHAGE
jgi:manganese-dependent inorganic pyrophosphatase